MHSCSILVVEDNQFMQLLLVSLLRKHYAVRSATHGREALERIAQETPDLILSDLMMPELDGLGLLRAVREDPRYCGIPFIMLTAKTDVAAQVEALQAGADRFLAKPWDKDELLKTIEKLLPAYSI